MESTDIKQVVKEKYGEAARQVKSGGTAACGTVGDGGCG